MEWARLYLDHRYLQMMCAQYIPSLWFITTIPNDGFLIKDRSTRLMKTLMTWRTSFFFVRAPPIFFAEIFLRKLLLNDFTLPKKIPSAKHVSQFYRFTEARAGIGLNFSGLSFFRAFRFELGQARAF